MILVLDYKYAIQLTTSVYSLVGTTVKADSLFLNPAWWIPQRSSLPGPEDWPSSFPGPTAEDADIPFVEELFVVFEDNVTCGAGMTDSRSEAQVTDSVRVRVACRVP